MSITYEKLMEKAGYPTPAIQAEVSAKIDECISVINNAFGVTLTKPTVLFDLKGHTAGKAIYADNTIRVNLPLYNKYHDDMLHKTVPHEFAHLAAYQLFTTRFHNRTARHHGKEWAMIMHILGLKAERCHQYDTEPARQRKRPYTYRCSCRQHKLTVTIHKRIAAGKTYHCRNCKEPIKEVTLA